MRTLLLIAFSMFTMAGCLDEAPARQDETAENGVHEDPAPEPQSPPQTDRIPQDDLAGSPHEVTRCVISDDCVLEDPDTEYRMCDLKSGTCIRNVLPF